MPTEPSTLALALGRLLFTNGQSTRQTIIGTEALASAAGLKARLLPRWGELVLQSETEGASALALVAAEPTGVDMHRVSLAWRTALAVSEGRLSPALAFAEIHRISKLPSVSTGLFALAAAAGALSLAVIYGVDQWSSVLLIVLSAGFGAVLRRRIAAVSSNVLLQTFAAALLAGIIGALDVRFGMPSALRLVAICPCMILVPGPHLLNGAFDLIEGRIDLGVARLTFALLITASIAAGLLLGMTLLGVSLPLASAGRTVPIWQDVIPAGVAVACYATYFSMPWRMIGWPVAVGMLAHALHWAAIVQAGMDLATGALAAGLAVGTIMAPVARRLNLPFAAVGFASVVSMMPGVFLFRFVSGLVQIQHGGTPAADLINVTIADGVMALAIVMALSLGLIIPKWVFDFLTERRARVRPEGPMAAPR